MSAVGSIAADKPLPNGSEIGRGGGALGEGREKELSSKAQLTKLLRDTLDYETRRLKELKDAGDEKRLKERTTKYVAYLFKRRRSIEVRGAFNMHLAWSTSSAWVLPYTSGLARSALVKTYFI